MDNLGYISQMIGLKGVLFEILLENEQFVLNNDYRLPVANYNRVLC